MHFCLQMLEMFEDHHQTGFQQQVLIALTQLLVRSQLQVTLALVQLPVALQELVALENLFLLLALETFVEKLAEIPEARP